MHFEFLVEDLSGEELLNALLPKLIPDPHTFTVKHYKGIGRLPKNLDSSPDPKRKQLLNKLPSLVKGYGKTFAGYGADYRAALFIVCDLDDKCLKELRSQLVKVLNDCIPRPYTKFCIAIEEMEAWLLGDIQAIKRAYPNAKDAILESYRNDAICDTWELLANAIYPGGVQKLKEQGYPSVGLQKRNWARDITPFIRMEKNRSPSFQYLVNKVREAIVEYGEAS